MGGCDEPHADLPLPREVAEVVVVNAADSFTVALVGLGYTGTVDRMWPCSGTQARLSLGTSTIAGSVRIRVYDHAGTAVYDNLHGATMGGLTAPTKPGGAAGTWRVILDFTGATWTGAISFDADNPQTNDAVSIGTGAISDDIVTATARGTWTIQVDLNGCTLGGAISITNGS